MSAQVALPKTASQSVSSSPAASFYPTRMRLRRRPRTESDTDAGPRRRDETDARSSPQSGQRALQQALGRRSLVDFARVLGVLAVIAIGLHALTGQLNHLPFLGAVFEAEDLRAVTNNLGLTAWSTEQASQATGSLARDFGLVGLGLLFAAMVTVTLVLFRRFGTAIAWRRRPMSFQ
ncbi:MAG: hypothetical protein AAGG99_06160 [Pseudomonadota bacterium]